MPNQPDVILYTDGACSGNPGPGGWAAIMKHPASGETKSLSGGDPHTTNNRMELKGVIEGLRAIKPTQRRRVHLVSDSQYVIFGLTQWIDGWIAKGWRRGKGEDSAPVKNADLWKELYELTQRHDMTYEHVLGHRGHPENEECDRMAVAEIAKIAPRPQVTDGLESLARADVVIHVHGVCFGGEGPGGWAAVVQFTDRREVRRLSGSERFTTSNRMELTATLRALRSLGAAERMRIHLASNNGYLIDGLSKWMSGWEAKGWPKKIKHGDLWREIYELTKCHVMTFQRFQDDLDDPFAEECRDLAVAGMKALRGKKPLDRQRKDV